MRRPFICLALLIVAAYSICSSTTFMNPLNNACVNQCPWELTNIYYADSSTRACVTVCPTSPSLYANDNTQSCVSTCPWHLTIVANQSYYDNYFRRCVLRCPSSPSYYAFNNATSGVCLQYCPSPTYSLDANRTCVGVCPVLYFVNYTLNIIIYQCVARCPSNTYKNSTLFCVNATSCPANEYGDPLSGDCVANCPNTVSVKTYSDRNPNVKLCVYVCPANFYQQDIADNYTCVSACLTNYFIDFFTYACVQNCPNATYSYDYGNNGVCLTSCPNSFYADPLLNACKSTCTGGRFRDATNNFCVLLCPPGYFGDVTAGYICNAVCSVSTEFGNPVSRLCVNKTSCPSPYLYADDFSRQCVTLCPQSQNTYGSPTQNACKTGCPWSASLYSFKDPSTQTCVTACPVNPSSYADNSSSSCVQSCPLNFYAVDASRTCESSCPNNFYINNLTRQCVSTCPIDPVITYYYAANSSSSQCLQFCPTGFLANPVTLTCINTLCPSNPSLFAWNQTCIPICPDATFSNTDTRTCDGTCSGLYLKDNSTKRCVTLCPDNPNYFADWTTNTCVATCPPLFFADSSIRECVSTCNQTNGLLAYTPLRLCVLTCLNNTYSHNGVCITICPNTTAPYYYIDITTKSCVASCPDYYFRNDFLGKCVTLGGCSNSEYADYSSRSCVQYCNSTISTYRDNSTMSCVSYCPYGLFGDYSVANQKQCVVICPAGTWFADNSTWTCVQVCPTNPSYYADLSTKTCVSHCRVELDLFAYDGNRTCVTQCPANTSADIYTRRCLDNCLLLPSTYLYVNGTERVCILQCPIGFFADNSTRNCVTGCPAGPNYFADWFTRTCVSLCSWTSTTNYYADASTRTCVANCPNSTALDETFRDKTIRICMAVCTGNQFSDNSTGDCVQVCPTTPDYFGQMANKICVLHCNRTLQTYAQNITRLCVAVCPAGSFSDNFTQRCVARCPVSQLYYGDPSTHRCVLTCPSFPSLYANNVTQTCVSTCPGFTYGSPTARVCEFPKNCSAGFFADNYTKLCVANCPATQASYAQSISKYCVRRCPVGTFADNSSYTCIGRCPDSPSYFGYEEKCLVSCPINTYADTSTRLCVVSSLCTGNTWGDPTSQKCVSACPFNYFADRRNTTKICVLLCPLNFYADDLTKDCVQKCPDTNFTYGTNTTRRCVEVCPLNQFAQNDTRMCMTACPGGSYADANVRVCVSVCSATPNLYGRTDDNTCVYTCPSSPDWYAQNSTRMCVADCPFNQSTFADRLARRCVLTCPVSAFTYADNHTRRCQANCTYNTTLNVKTYSDNSTLTCVARCPTLPQYYADISTGTGLCVPFCPNSTVPKIFSDNSTRICQPMCNISLFYYSINSTGNCVIKCPGGTFADNETQSCVARCPGRETILSRLVDTFGYQFDRTCVTLCVFPFFSQNSSRLCVYFCPQLEYADTNNRRCVSNCDGQKRQYADNSTNNCVETCPTLPDTFADNNTHACVSPCPVTAPIGYNCTNACPLNTWADNFTRQCKDKCAQNATFLPQFADNYTGRCVQYCPRNLFTYADKVSFSCVSQCPPLQVINAITHQRTFADDSTKTCVFTCPTNPWTFAENDTRICVFKCPVDSYGENNTRQCVQNCTFWGTYAEKVTTFCVSRCPQNSFADNNTMSCVGTCPAGTFADNSTWKCVLQCPSNPALYGDTTTKICVINCPDSLYGDDFSRMCVPTCPTIPTIYYSYAPTRKCYLNCLFPYFGQPESTQPTYGRCETYCFLGQYKNMTTHRCQKCKVECTQCVSLLGCQSCITNFYLFNGTCLTGCASGTGSSCKSACPYNNITNTITYADRSSLSCVEICPITGTGGSFGLNETLFCVESCPITYYASNITRRCELCVDGCNNCTSPQRCFSCYPGYIFSRNLCVRQCSITLPFYFGTACLQSCIEGTYLMTDQITCGACSSICSTCSLIASNCTKCVGAYLYNYNCVTKCPNNFYPDTNLSCQVCTSTVVACNIEPLTYVLKSYSKGGQLYGILTFNRATYMDISRIKQIVNISIPGLASSQYSWTASRINDTSYKLPITTSVSLNQLSLVLTFTNPALVIDSQGGSITETSTVSPLPTFDYISAETRAASKSTQSFSEAISWLAIAIMVVLLFKGSYTLLIASQVFQMIFFHYFIFIELPYNFSNFLIGLKAFDFFFLPNILKDLVPSQFVSPDIPTYWTQIIPDTVFFISSGQFLIIIIGYLSWAVLITVLKNRTVNKFNKLRRFAKGVFNRRIRYGVINQCLWFCYISFVFFGLWQLRDLKISGSWGYGNILFSLFAWISCLFLTFWVVYLSIRYKDKMEKLPKRFSFILGQDSHIPFEMPLRHIRKLLFCIFLAIGSIQATLITIIGANFMMLSFYLFFKPAKSRFSNWTHIFIELCYIGLEVTLLLYVNEIKPTTQLKLNYGLAMIALSISALLFLIIWLVWQFLLFLYDFKFVRDIIEETKLANQIHPEQDNLRVQLDKQYEKEEIVNESISAGSNEQQEQDTIEGIEKQYNNQVVHYIEEKKLNVNPRIKKSDKSNNNQMQQSESNNQPRLISSRASSRMLFADLNIEDIE